MIKILQSISLALVSVGLLTSCGGGDKVKVADDLEKFQKWQLMESSLGQPVATIMSYDYNIIDSVPIAMQIIYSQIPMTNGIKNNSDLNDLWGISFVLLNISADKGNIETPKFDNGINSIKLSNDHGYQRDIKVFNIVNEALTVVYSKPKQVPEEVEQTLRDICNYENVAISAKLNDGKQYTWKFHSHLDLPK